MLNSLLNLYTMGILQLGFKNVFRSNTATGFQVKVVNNYYRGTYISLTEGFDVTVDGESFPRDLVSCTFGDQALSQDELEGNRGRWQFMEPVTLTVTKPGGLKPGIHEVKVDIPQRISYMPIIPVMRSFTANIAIVK